ncbi:uncharacterized protein Z519_07051 [Cladophialophora bantiana CBS 173.52]|uniref:Uncharacterized protein n=1 Tax=Cladophialophora bantiana (strain ATCC 10958 / CBS 173.52 / CDC B-1940 / NIH 8579) TaxID=1442370 RepID=A0A0D2HFP5_CLAB1|nr:uncharacterized protein Z519_07051 [Cladophialophora bantiana CBS 173.52]KIW92068.1 hypothetical protein Z519_07051 [Cladophialophora bantiana CBS 173.52]
MATSSFQQSGRIRGSKRDPAEQIPIPKVITDIIRKKTGNINRTSVKFAIKDIARLLVKSSLSKTGKTGTALVIFCDPVPGRYLAMMQSSDREVLSGDGDDDGESSVDVNIKFIGTAQLYEPQSEENIVTKK